MAHWPKTVRGNLVAVVLGVCGLAFLAQTAVALSGPVVWALVAGIALTAAVVYVRLRRVHAMSDAALADAPSFADALSRTNRTDANEARELLGP